MALIDYGKKGKGGKPVLLTPRVMKARVMAQNGWTSEQYKKQYDIFKNRATNYSRIVGEALPHKINELFYLKQTSQKRWGAEYRASRLISAIEATTSESTGAALRRGKKAQAVAAAQGKQIEAKPVYGAKQLQAVSNAILKPFEALLRKSPNTRKKLEELAGDPAAQLAYVKQYAESRRRKSEDGLKYQVGYD